MTEKSLETEMRLSLVELQEDRVLELVQIRLARGDDPMAIIEVCQEGMRQVGERYERREYYLSGLMMAGEIFREVMEIVEPRLVERLHGSESGHILLGTVQGDIHDIGKNIFGTMLRCHGFTVTDLNVDVPPAEFFTKARALHPDIVGLSGLLTISYDVMRETIQLFRQAENPLLARTPIMIGGGLLNSEICTYIGADYWAIDAMVGVRLCKELMGTLEPEA